MIKREILKQAIDAISSRDPETGYVLDEMLGMGRIDVPPPSEVSEAKDPFFFLFDNQRIRVSKFMYLQQGTVPIELLLLVQYGALVKKQELLDAGQSIHYAEAAKQVQAAGLGFVVFHEIDYAIARLKRREKRGEDTPKAHPETTASEIVIESSPFGTEHCGRTCRKIISFLENLKQPSEDIGLTEDGMGSKVLFQGLLEGSSPAFFVRFPFSLNSLMQVAEINLEFFHLRYVLDCLVRGKEANLFACVREGKILGMISLTCRRQLLYRGLEVKYLATVPGNAPDSARPPSAAPRGIGTFLLAGAWLCWKSQLPGIKEVCLEAEIGARAFYESAGFQKRGPSAYVLRHPKGYLLKSILEMIGRSKNLPTAVIEGGGRLLQRRIKGLRKTARSERARRERAVTVETLEACLKSDAREEISTIAVINLLRYQNRIAESRQLLSFARQHGSKKTKAYIKHATTTSE